MKTNPFHEFQEREIACWPGVTFHHEIRGKHMALVLAFNGKTAKVFYPITSSDSGRGPKNSVSVIRRTLTAMGATRGA